MKTSSKGLDLIKKHEGCSLEAYLCPAGVMTIGYGHTTNVNSGDVITEREAAGFLQSDLKTAENEVNKQLPMLSQYQFDALVSFVFNVGTGNFRSSTLLKKVKLNAYDPSIASEFAKWNKARNSKGSLVVLSGLTRRRREESELYFNLR